MGDIPTHTAFPRSPMFPRVAMAGGYPAEATSEGSSAARALLSVPWAIERSSSCLGNVPNVFSSMAPMELSRRIGVQWAVRRACH